MKIGEAIKSVIKQKGISQIEVAQKIQKSPTALSQIINGAYNPNAETLAKIADALEVPPQLFHLLTISDDKVPESNREVFKLMIKKLESYLIDGCEPITQTEKSL